MTILTWLALVLAIIIGVPVGFILSVILLGGITYILRSTNKEDDDE